jgi:hypothetical protein
VKRALLLLLMTVSCASEYSRRLHAADDPSNPDATPSKVEQVSLYQPDAGAPR